MSVFDGPRRETRRVVYGGSVYWAMLADGRLELGNPIELFQPFRGG